MACAVALWVYNEMPKLSTVQVAKLLGMHQPNFQRAIKRGTIPAPPLANVGGGCGPQRMFDAPSRL